jgi:hypothetical protein
MATHQNTIYGNADKLYSTEHRKLGKQIYMADLDSVEFHYVDSKLVLVAVIDYKNGNAKLIGTKYPGVQAQLLVAEGLSLPFYICLDYLAEEIPMYYLLPINTKAKIQLSDRRPSPGVWMSPKEFSQFQHSIRNITFNHHDPDLQKLSDTITTYPLPTIQL